MLEQAFKDLHNKMMAIPYVMLVAGFLVHIHKSNGELMAVLNALVKVSIIALVIANSHVLFKETEKLFIDLASHINKDYEKNPLKAVAKINDTSSKQKRGLIATLRGEGVYESISLVLGKFFVMICSLIQIPILVIQYFIVRVGYLAFPFLVTTFMFPSLMAHGTRYISHVLSVMAWPIGFAITGLIAGNILSGFSEGVSGSSILGAESGTTTGDIGAALAASLMVVFGTITTPKMMNGIFSSGVGLGADAGRALTGMVRKGMAVGTKGTSIGVKGMIGGAKAVSNVQGKFNQSRFGGQYRGKQAASGGQYRMNGGSGSQAGKATNVNKIPRGVTSDV